MVRMKDLLLRTQATELRISNLEKLAFSLCGWFSISTAPHLMQITIVYVYVCVCVYACVCHVCVCVCASVFNIARLALHFYFILVSHSSASLCSKYCLPFVLDAAAALMHEGFFEASNISSEIDTSVDSTVFLCLHAAPLQVTRRSSFISWC